MSNNLSEENQQLLEEKIARLEKALILETRADERLRLEHEIKELKGKSSPFNRLKNHKNQYVIIGIGGFLLVIVLIGIFLVPRSNIETNITNTTKVETINNVGTQIIHKYNPETIEKVLKLTEEKLEITKIAFYTFLEIAGEKQVPIEQLPVVMGQMAERYKSLLQGVKNLENTDDPEVKELVQKAEQLLIKKVDLDQAEKFLNQAHAKKKDKKSRLKEMLHKEEIEQAAISFQIGEVNFTQLKYKEAEEYYRRAAEELPKDEEKLFASYLNNAVLAMLEDGKYSQAIPLAEQVLDILEKKHGKEHPSVANSLNNLALLYEKQGKYPQSEPLYLRAVKIKEKILGKEHPSVAMSLNNLAELYREQGKYAQAEPLCLRALDIREKNLDKKHPDVAQSLNNLAALYKAQEKYVQAEPLYQRSLDIHEEVYGKEHPFVATNLSNLASLYNSQGKYAQSEPLHLRALEIRKKTLGAEHPDVATSLNGLAVLYYAQGKYAQAEPLYVRALEIYEKIYGKEHPNIAISLNNLGMLYDDQGKYAQADPLYVRALEIDEKILGKEHPNTQRHKKNYEKMKKKQAESAEKAVQ
jgi:tetratricopeptide (TPR) repeat protein